MEANNYKFLFFITIISLCVFNGNLYAQDESDNANNECREALVSTLQVLEPVGTSNNTKMVEVSIADTHIPGIKKGLFSFFIGEQKKEIEIEYKFDDDVDAEFLSLANFEFLKEVLDQMPASLLSKVNKMTVLITERRFQLPKLASEGARIFSREEQRDEAYNRPVANEINLVIPYPSQSDDFYFNPPYDDYRKEYFNAFFGEYVILRMRHKLGHIMLHHRYGGPNPGQNWREAVSKDNESVSRYGDTSMAEDFAEAMTLYLSTNGGLGRSDIVEKYPYRFAILDEIMGVTPSERQRITVRNGLLEEQNLEINHLLELLGIVDNEGKVYKGIEGDEDGSLSMLLDIPAIIKERLSTSPNGMRILRELGDKALILQKNGQLNFTSARTSSARENLIRRLIWPGLFLIHEDDKSKIPEFITETIDLIDTLSGDEAAIRLRILNRAYAIIEEEDPSRGRLDSVSYEKLDSALKRADLETRRERRLVLNVGINSM